MEQVLECLRKGVALPTPLVPTLYEYGAFFVLKDLPVGSEFGIDYKSWNTGEKFLGLKMIPPGVHFVYVSMKGAPRIGFLHNFAPREVLVKQWNKREEELSRDAISEEDIEKVKANLRNLDSNLGAYPYEEYRKWYSLTDFVSPEDVERIQPLCGFISSQAELESLETKIERESGAGCSSRVDKQNPRRMRFADSEGLPVMEVKAGYEIRFISLPEFPGDGGRTTDYSLHLEKVLRDLTHRQLLAELQIAFVMFLIGQVYEGLEQWKKLVHLTCLSPSSIPTNKDFFLSFLRVIFFQLRECPQDFFVDIVSRDNFLTTTLSLLFLHIQESEVGEDLKKKSRNFKTHLEKTFKWQFEV